MHGGHKMIVSPVFQNEIWPYSPTCGHQIIQEI